MVRANESLYPGTELDLFSSAANWKRYIKEEIGPYLVGDVLEVGAGIGGTTRALHDGTARRWVCLEPDVQQAKRIQILSKQWHPDSTKVVAGSLPALAGRPSFDSVLYIDVLEHIEDDALEIQRAARLLRTGGHLVILAPAHQWLFSEFDKSIGHLRRYNKRQLKSLMPAGWAEKKARYLDSVGVVLSLANALALRQSMPTPLQVAIWDRWCVPVSRFLDRLYLGHFGKSILAVWCKQEPDKL